MATTKKEALAPGEARSRGKQIQELLDEETVEVPWQLRHAEYTYLGSEPLDRDHYISQEWCDKEIENLMFFRNNNKLELTSESLLLPASSRNKSTKNNNSK